ncbi:MAG: Ig-like domain-containing protein, partial [Chitinophagales bacterium]
MKLSFTRYIPVCFLLFLVLFSDTNLFGASIGDWIWADANDNGLLEAGEGGIGDTDVELFDNSGNLISTTQSNHDGYYIFKDLAAGTYTVAIVQSMLVAPLTTPSSYTVTLTENEQYLTADFGQLTTFSTSNKPPVIITKNACTAPQTPVTVCLEIFEPEGDNTAITGGSTQTGATFTILNEDCFRYTPLPGYEGIDSVFVMVCDDANPPRCVEGTIAVSVPCAGGSLAVDDEVTTTQSTPIIIEVLGNDNGQAPLEVTNVEDSPNGTTLLVNNIVVYTPDPGFIGIDSFTYSITDISNQTSSATVYITVVELPIVCELEMMQCVEVDANIVLCPEYCAVEGSSLNVIEIMSQVGGELIESPTETGCYKYIPPTDFLGDDVVTVLACNEEGNCAKTTLAIEVKTSCDTGGNDIIAVDDFAVAIENTFVLLGVLGNDSDPQGDDFSLQSFIQPPNGVVTETEEGLLKYEPNPNFVGVDVFTYTICDVNGNCAVATVTIEVISDGIQDCTEVAEICDNASAPTEICIEFCNVNDAVITGLSSVFEATLNINSATCFNYAAPEGFAGLDEVDVIGCNMDGECDTILVTVLVACPVPTANDDTGTIAVEETLNLNVLENDAQKCDYTLSASLIGGAQMGEVALESNGDLSYTPNQGAMGQEILTYVACNDCSQSLCDTATVTIMVGDGVNQAPIAANDNALTLPNTATEVFILANDSDPDGDNLTATIATPPTNGTVAINPDTQIATYTPNEGFTGTDTFTYEVCDDGEPSLCSTATVTVTVGDVTVNNPPVAVDDSIVTQLNQLIGIGVLGNDSDPDGDALTITSISSEPLNGTVEIVGFNNSSVNYTPNFNFIGVDSFEYVICDPLGACDTALVKITVINPGGNLPPTAIDDDATTGINTPISIEVLANDNDPEGGELTISTINSNPSNGTATINGGVVDYVPNTGFTGEDSFEYVVCDPQGLC